MRSLLAIIVPLAACGSAGSLHQATLMGQCAEADASCSRRHSLTPIAVGAHFHPDVTTEIAGTAMPSLHLDSAAPDVLALDGASLLAKKPGSSAVLISTDDGSVVDFVQLWVAPVTAITLARRDGEHVSGTVGLAVGEDLTLVPALWNGAQQLAGEQEATWTLTGDATFSVLRDGAADRRRLRARGPGKAQLTVAMGDTKTTLDVEVVQ